MSEEPAIKRILEILTRIQNIEPLNMVLFSVDNDPDEPVLRLAVVWEFERTEE
jgi:hypothetical protein